MVTINFYSPSGPVPVDPATATSIQIGVAGTSATVLRALYLLSANDNVALGQLFVNLNMPNLRGIYASQFYYAAGLGGGPTIAAQPAKKDNTILYAGIGLITGGATLFVGMAAYVLYSSATKSRGVPAVKSIRFSVDEGEKPPANYAARPRKFKVKL
jgi:hypothetical protein